jgi:hypothetical protein
VNLVFKLTLLCLVLYHLLTEGCSSHALFKELVIRVENSVFSLSNQFIVLVSQLLDMKIAVLKHKILQPQTTKTNTKAFISLGVKFDRLYISLTIPTHKPDQCLHNVGGRLRILGVQVVEDALQVIDSDILLKVFDVGLLLVNLRLKLDDL